MGSSHADAARAWIVALRARPLHLGMGALVAGLAAGPRAGVAWLAVLLALAVAAGGRRPAGALAAVALLVGASIGQARMAAIDRTALGPRLGHAVDARATLLEAPRRLPFGMRAALVRLDGERVQLRASARAWPRATAGAELSVRGALAPLGPRDGWLRARSVHALLAAHSIAATGARRGGLSGVVDRVRERAERALTRGLPADEAGLMRGMALGQDDALAPVAREEFRAAGLSHLTAASGQNVALLAALAIGACALAGIGLRVRLLAVLALIALYVPLAGAGPSIQRAGVMGAATVVAILAGRPAARWHALALAAAVTLALDPRALEQPGWQLSFAAVVAILALAPGARSHLRRAGAPPALAEALAMTVAATVGTAPLLALHFDRVSVVALPANVLAVAAVAPVMWLGMVAAAIGQVSAAAAAPATALAALPLAYLSWLAHVAAHAPGAQLDVGPVPALGACTTLALALGPRRGRALAPLAALATIGALLALAPAPPPEVGPPAGARVTFLDVGQGDATLLQHRGVAILVDAGPPDGRIVASLRRAGVRRLDVLVVTHAQADHQGGAPAVLAALPVGLVLDGRDGVGGPDAARVTAAVAQAGARLVRARAGQRLAVGAIALRVLWPSPAAPGALAGADPNQRSTVIEATLGGARVLLAADAESDVLAALDLRAADLLKVSHHGSDDPGLPALLSRLRPRLAAIEVGRGNRYGHPAPATLRALHAAGVTTYRTDRDGSVRVELVRGALRVQPHA